MHVWNNPKHLRNATMFLYTIIVGVLVAAGVIYIVNSPYFPIRKVDINGQLDRTDQKQLQALTEKNVRGNIFKINLNEIKAEYEQLPWLKSVQIKRMWPDTIVVNVIEHQPVARWKDGGLIDETGTVFYAASNEVFPVFDAKKAVLPRLMQFYLKSAALFDKQDLSMQQLTYNNRASWSILLNDGVVLKLGRQNIDDRVARFLTSWSTVLAPQKNVLEYVDLRYKDGFAVKHSEAKKKLLDEAPNEVPQPLAVNE